VPDPPLGVRTFRWTGKKRPEVLGGLLALAASLMLFVRIAANSHVHEPASWRRDLAVVEIGAGGALPTVRRQAEFASAATGALIRINVREPQVRDPRGVGIAGPAAEVLLALDARTSEP